MSSGKPETLKPEALTLSPKPGFCCMGLSFWGSFGKPRGLSGSLRFGALVCRAEAPEPERRS